MNAKNIINAFNSEIKSFNVAIRFIFDMSNLPLDKIAATPSKNDNSDEAKALRKAIKLSEKKNELINDCRAICERFQIADVKAKNIPTYRNIIMSNVPLLDVNGQAVKIAKLPSYLKDDIANYNNVYVIANMSWIETIIAAASNESGKQMTDYNVTTSPIIIDGNVEESASGDIVNVHGKKIDNDTIFETWNKIASYRNIANAAGREIASAKLNDLKNGK